MANPWRIAAIGTTISISGWFLSPIISLLVNKIISYVTLDSSAKLRSLKIQTVPELKRLLREAEEQKALSAERRGNAGDVARLDDVLKDVRSALHLADDILDLVEYHRHEKKAVTGRDRLSSWISWLFAAAGACVARCDGRSRLGPRCGGGEPARWLLRAAVGPCISRSRSAAAVLPTRRPRLVGSSLGRGRRWRDSVLTSPRKMVQAACSCRRCFCDTVATLFGTSYQQEIGSESSYTVPGFSRIRLKKLLKKIEKLINEAEKTLGLGNLPRKNRNGDHITNITAKYIGKPSTANPPLKVTGRDENRDHLISMLHATEHNDSPSSSDATCYSLVGIHGIPGSGKTTLAQYICESEKNASYFDLVMWVHVTQNFTVDTIYREMFEAASGDRKPCPSYNSLDVLQSNLEEKLRGKRFLLVLDDIWRDKDSHGHKLEQLLYPLKVGKRGSKILVTSRSADALSDLGLVRVEHFEIPELRCDDFLQLFMFCALGDMPVDNRDIRIFEVIGAEIAKKLKGSPLAATIVGRRLRRHRDIKYWMEFNAREHLDDVVRNLCWSFQHFDEETRQCFAYCSIFPRRYQLERDELVKLWVAQGIITRTNGEEKEDAAQRCFHDLVSASFLRPGYDYYSRQRFTIHDLLHDLAKNVAGSDCFTIEKDGSGNVPSDVCHLFIQSYDGTDLSKVFSQSSNMRTMIIIHTEDTKRLCVEEVFGCVSTLTKLRALILKVEVIRLDYSENVSVPESIGRLKHLRYLAFGKPSCERIILPCTFAQLYHMEMLDVKPFTSLAFSSGEDTGNLINLRDLVSSKDLDAPYIGTLESLRTLKHFPVRKGKGYELSQLKKLNKLGGTISIDGLENVASREDALDAKLHRKVFLREVKLSWRANSRANAEEQDLQSDVLEALCPPVQIQALKIAYYKGSRYPSWMTMGDPHIPMCLRDLTLFCCSELGPIPTHSELFSHLRTLHICYCGQNSLPDSMENLVSLIELEIKGFWGIASLPTLPRSLKELTVDGCWEITSFPTLPWTLEKLTIDGCLKVNSLPRTMPPNMVFFTLSSCHCDFVRSCETVGHENWEKIRHIRDRIIRYKPPPDDISSSEDCGDDE